MKELRTKLKISLVNGNIFYHKPIGFLFLFFMLCGRGNSNFQTMILNLDF